MASPLHFEKAFGAALKEFVRAMEQRGMRYVGIDLDAAGNHRVDYVPTLQFSSDPTPDTPTRAPSLDGLGSGWDSVMNYAREAEKVELAAKRKVGHHYEGQPDTIDLIVHVKFLQKSKAAYRTVGAA